MDGARAAEGERQGRRRIWDERPVSVRRFVQDEGYLGLGESVYPRILQTLSRIFRGGYEEAVLCWGIGSGKSYLCSLALLYVLYKTLCLREPQKYFGLAEGSQIHIVNVGPTARVAEKVVYGDMRRMVRDSRWFQEHYPADGRSRKELNFPKNVTLLPGNSSETFPLGLNVLCATMDEAAFFVETRDGEREAAEEIYLSLQRRIQSRFGRKGLMMIASSPRHSEDFIMKKLAEAQSDPTIFGSRRATWEVKPGYGKARFEHKGVLVPREFEREFTRNADKAMRDLAAAPGTAYQPYFADVEALAGGGSGGAEGDGAGHGRGLKPPFFGTVPPGPDGDGDGVLPRRCAPPLPETSGLRGRGKAQGGDARRGLKPPPFGTVPPGPDGDGNGSSPLPLSRRLLRKRPERGDGSNNGYGNGGNGNGYDNGNGGPADSRPLRTAEKGDGLRHPFEEDGRLAEWFRPDDRAPRYVHIDLGLKKDACGIAMAKVVWEDGRPVAVVELMQRVKAPPGGEVDIAYTRELVLALRRRGFPLGQVSYDGYQSADSLQILRRYGVRVATVSVDRDLTAYETLKEIANDGRLRIYRFEPLLRECRRLELIKGTKVDHPPGGSKDVADAVAGAVSEAVRGWSGEGVRGRIV